MKFRENITGEGESFYEILDKTMQALNLINVAAKEIGIGRAGIRTLSYLAEMDKRDEPTFPGRITKSLGWFNAQTTRALDELRPHNYIEEQIFTEDKRNIEIKITPRGKRAYQKREAIRERDREREMRAELKRWK